MRIEIVKLPGGLRQARVFPDGRPGPVKVTPKGTWEEVKQALDILIAEYAPKGRSGGVN